MAVDINWETARKFPEQGSYIYVEQISPVRAFIGRVILIWLNGEGRNVIAVADDNGDVVNLAEDDRWVQYNAEPYYSRTTDIEILHRTHGCPCCDSPLLTDSSGAVYHPWLWD